MKKGWQTKKLGDVCDFEGGSQPPKSEFIYDEKPGYVRFLQIRDFGSDKNITYIPHSKKNRLCDENDILIGRYGASVGKILTGKAGAYNVALMKTIPNLEVLDQSWFYHFLVSDEFQTPLLNVADRSAQAGFSKDDIYNFPVPVPPLAEQQRIVGLLDEAFEGLATAKANAEKNLQNARALFESHLQSVFTQRGANWDNVTLETLLERGWIESHLDGNHGGDYPRKEEFVQEGVPYISANCLDDDDRIDMSRAKYLSPARAALLRKGIAKNNDVLFAHNATVGPVAILQTDEEKVILGTSLTYYRCNTKHILPVYLAHYMRSFGFKKQYLQVMCQSTRNQVPITKQREFFHVIPPLEEQKRIIVTLDGLLENGQRLARLYEQKLAALEALKKSLLHQAFTGEL